ncbi:MAG TPA: YbaK/EbsC family protein [Streptosporangiaceae bacterium]|nr:YbaK/EbsC family protein [Streptosporangiaceae bacterium]
MLRGHGFAGEVRALPVDVPTAAAAAGQLGCPVGAIANSLVFAAGGRPVLVLTSGAHRVDTRRLAARLGVGRGQVRAASPDFVLAVTGQVAGGVAPVGHLEPITTFIDLWLDRHPRVWAGAGQPHLVFATTFAELAAVTGGEPAEVGGE